MRFRTSGRHVGAAADKPEDRENGGRRRISRPAALTALIAVGAVSLAASAAAPSRGSRPAASRQRPSYLQPVGALVQHGYLPFPALLGDTGSVGVPSGTRPGPTRPDPAVAARQAPAIAQFQGADGTLTPAGIATLALEHGCSPSSVQTATAIAMAESGGSPSAQGDIGLMTAVWDWSAGLWQIRGLRAERGTGGLRDSIANQDAETNANAMYAVSHGCTDWTPWSTYNSGVYQQFLPIAAQAVRYVMAYYATHGHRYPPVGTPDPTATIPVQGSGATTGGYGRPAASTRTRSSAPKPAHRSAHKTVRQRPTSAARASRTAARPAPPPATPQPTASKPRISLPVPTPTLPTKSLPIPSVTLPTPSLSVPSLPGLP